MGRADLAEEIVAAQRQVMKELLRATLGDLLEADLTMAQMKALAVIERQPECSIGMLSAQLGVKPPAASLVVDKLVRDDLAYRLRDPTDGRRVIVEVTTKGGSLISRIRQGQHSLLECWVGRLGDDDLVALNRGIRALAGLAHAFPVEPSASRAEAVEVGRG